MLEILGLVGLAVAILWLGRIFYILQKGLNELITGMSSIDQRLARLEHTFAAERAQDPEQDLEQEA